MPLNRKFLKGLVYANNWHASDIEKLEARIKYCLKKIDIGLLKQTLVSTRPKILQFRRYGVIEDNK